MESIAPKIGCVPQTLLEWIKRMEIDKRCHKAGVIPHVARKRIGSAIDGRVARTKAYRTSIKVRKRIEEAFGWLKTVGGLRKTKLIGRAKLVGQTLLCFVA